MKKKNNRNNLFQAALIVGIVLTLLLPLSQTGIATDTTPPTFDSAYCEPSVYIGPLSDCVFYGYVDVYDNVAVSQVRFVVTGPGYSYNQTVDPSGGPFYEIWGDSPPSYGTYAMHFWASDTSGNTAVTPNFYAVILAQSLPYVHVAAGTPLPWDGSVAHPFPTIGMGLAVASDDGTVYTHQGIYFEAVGIGNRHLIGENRDTTIIDGSQTPIDGTVDIANPTGSSIDNFTIRNGVGSDITIGPRSGAGQTIVSHASITHCTITQSPIGIAVAVLAGSTGNRVENCSLINNGLGLILKNSPNITQNFTIKNSIIANNGQGIVMWTSRYNTISNCLISDNTEGAFLSYATHNIFDGCTISSNTKGIILLNSMHNVITNANIQHNTNGIFLNQSWYNNITNCLIQLNTGAGIYFAEYGSQNTGNSIFRNTFIANQHHVHLIIQLFNAWDDGTVGNYWDDYNHPGATVNTATGTWSIPYQIFYDNIDHHPWVYPAGYIDTIPPAVTVLTPNGGEIVSGIVSLTWTASDNMVVDLDGAIRLEYSTDAGSTWHLLANGIDNTGSYPWNTTTLPDGSQYLIRVSASDLFHNIGSDVSDATFTISNHPNSPPPAPEKPSGSSSGFVGIQYSYSTKPVIDPDGDPVFYLFDFGDGSNSSWISKTNASHSFSKAGSYDVKVKAKDSKNASSDWSKALTVVITEVPEKPILRISSVTGGFGLRVTIKNNGTVNATNVSWSIALKGGIILIGNKTSDVIKRIGPDQEATIKSGFILGLGKSSITISATCNEGVDVEKTVNGFVVLFFILGVK